MGFSERRRHVGFDLPCVLEKAHSAAVKGVPALGRI
jgi:hypothetical protein